MSIMHQKKKYIPIQVLIVKNDFLLIQIVIIINDKTILQPTTACVTTTTITKTNSLKMIKWLIYK